MKLDTLKTVIRAFNTASDDSTRSICGVYLEPGKERREVTVTATNGHALSSVVCQDAEFCEAMGGMPMLVPVDTLPALKMLAKDAKTIQCVPCKWEGAGKDRVITLGQFGISVQLKAKEADQYPDYRQVIPKMPDDAFEFSFNAQLLIDLAKALDAGLGKKGQLIVKLQAKDKLSPMVVTMQGNRGVLMPCCM